MSVVYAFISYNRKVIIPAKVFEGQGTCTPSLHLGYRGAFIAVAWLLSSIVLSRYTLLLGDYLPRATFLREALICGGQIAFQAATISFLRKDRLIHYLGNLMAISLGGSMLLLPAFVLKSMGWIDNSIFYLGWFAIVVSLMLLEHIRRSRILEINFVASVSWIIYRLLVLAMIFYKH
jgi:hypothetical protein